MRTLHTFIAAFAAGLGALALALVLVARPAPADTLPPSSESLELAGKLNQLGGRTLKQLAGERNDKAVIVSPYGLGSALHLLLLGADGAAEKSLQAQLLPSGMSRDKRTNGMTALNKHLLSASGEKLTLTSSNAIFVPMSVAPSDTFKKRTREIFDATVEALDFKSPSALERINAWVKGATKGLIPRVIDELDPDARFVLTNAVYFNGAWETAFQVARTAKAPFTRADGSKRDVAMMDGTMPVSFADVGDLQAVWLPYDGKDVTMLVIAPGQNQGPAAVAEALKRKSLDDLAAEAHKQRRVGTIQVRLPRFRAESNLDVTDVLSRLELKAALSGGGTYSAINKARGGPLQVVHRAVVEVTEAGTRASAATAVTSDRSLAVTPIFSADRPFAFAIIHQPTQAVLFAGYIADPGDGPAGESKTAR